MKRRSISWLAAALLVIGVAVAPASSAAAADVASHLPWWTNFNPGAPQGGPMWQTYKNCNGYSIWVTPGYQQGNSRWVYASNCVLVPDRSYVEWHFDATVPNSNYETMGCNHYAFITGVPASTPPCWTTFNPGAPQGGPMRQTYRNCNIGIALRATPGYTRGNSHWAYVNRCTGYLAPQDAVYWDFEFTVPFSNYETMGCMLTGLLRLGPYADA